MTERTVAQALNAALDEALESPDVVLLGEDVGVTGGVFRVSDGLLEKHGPERVIDTPVAESGIIGAAFGMAIAGLRPIAEIQFMGFSYPAVDQIINHVGRIRNRSRHRFTAPMVVRIPYGGGIGAAEHHSESAEAMFVHTPGVKVVVPSNPYDAKGLLLAAIDDPAPVVVLEPIRIYRSIKGEVPDGHYTVPIGLAAMEHEGRDVTLIAYGAMMKEARAAAAQLEDEGVSVELIDLRSLVPFDTEMMVDSVRKTGRAVVIQEAHRSAGMASEVAAVLQEHALYHLNAPIERITGWDVVIPLRRAEKHYLPTVEHIVAAAHRTLEA